MPDPSLNMAMRNVGSLNTSLRSVMTLGLSLQHVAYSETDISIAFGFDDVAVSSFTLSVLHSASILAFGFESVSVTGFDLNIDAGSDAIAFGFESVDVSGFDLSINEGEQIAFGFEDVSVAGFDLSITRNATAVAFGFDDVAVTGFAVGIEEGASFTQRRWRLDDLTEVGGATSFTNVNGVTFVSGKVGNCANFVSASSQRLDVSEAAFNALTSEVFTMWGWFKLATTGVNHGISGQNTSSYHCHVISTNKLRFRVNRATAGNRVVDSAETLVADTWYFYVVEYDLPNNTMRVELNRGTPTSGLINDATGLVSGTSAFTIGSIGTGNYCNGQIDQVGFRRGGLLTTTEKDDFYASGAGADF